MTQLQMSPVLTPETVEALVRNADIFKELVPNVVEVLRDREEDDHCHHSECCCPKKLKFKFICCNVWIENKNAVCPENGPS